MFFSRAARVRSVGSCLQFGPLFVALVMMCAWSPQMKDSKQAPPSGSGMSLGWER